MRMLWMSVGPTRISGCTIKGAFACAVILLLTSASVSFVSSADPVSAPPYSSTQPAAEEGVSSLPGKEGAAPAPVLPSPPVGVTDLKFNEFFVFPVGPRGLTLTQKLQ